MAKFEIVLALALLALASSSPTSPPSSNTSNTSNSSDLPRPSYARTMLKVSRSLPGETEELKVRTSEGNLATLIVKRREKSVSSKSASVPKEVTITNESSSSSAPSEPPPTTIGYQNVEVDPWSRLQTWSSVSDSSEQKQTSDESRSWQPLDSWKPVEQPFFAPSAEQPARSWLVADNLENSRSFQSIPADNDSGERLIRYAFLPHDGSAARRVRTNVGANLDKNRDAKNVPAEVVIRSEINVKPQPGSPGAQPQKVQAKRLPMSIDVDGLPIVHGRRVPDEPIDRIQVWRNARVINDQLVTDASSAAATTARGIDEQQSFERFFEDVNRRYGKTPDEESRKPYRNEVLAAEIYETGEDTYRPSIRKRMLQPEAAAAVTYPNSRIYSPPEAATRVSSPPSVKVGTRAPVLQYAHPELGVQPAKIVKNEKRRVDEEPQRQHYQQPQQQQQQQQYNYGEHRQKKKYVLNDKNIVDSYNYKNYYPNQHFYGIKRPIHEPPFWIKISENLKTQFTDGVAKVSELTKPVFDPLVEATRKISENLGLSSSRSQDPAQDKIGTVATGSSVLIPALGLMASGAALGIGAVAVGRYLDVDVLKRSNNGGAPLDYSAEESQRAMDVIKQLQAEESIARQLNGGENKVFVVVQDEGRQSGPVSRRKRSTEDVDERRMQRKGADSIAEIVEIDLPSRSLDDATNDEGNNIHVENEEDIAKDLVMKTLQAIVSRTQAKKDQKPNGNEAEAATLLRRKRRSLSDAELDDALQNLENAEVAEASHHIPGDWTNTPCAKRIFCDAMVKRGSDAYMFMEKKMSGLLRMIQPGAAVQVSAHFDEVMDAVRRHDCTVFSCPQARPASIFV